MLFRDTGVGMPRICYSTPYEGSQQADVITVPSDVRDFTVDAKDGDDTIAILGSDGTVSAGGGNDTIILTGNNVVVSGDAGDDMVRLEEGSTGGTLSGGAGNDTLTLADLTAGVTIDLRDAAGSGQVGTISRDGQVLATVDATFETIVGTQYDDVIYAGNTGQTLLGGGGNDFIDGGQGRDTLIGGTGNDTFAGGQGADVMIGGGGVDGMDYSTSAAGVTANLATGSGSGGDAQGDTYVGISNLTGSAFADTLIGNAGDNVFTGGAGNDTIIGGGGNDSAVYTGTLADYVVTQTATDTWVLADTRTTGSLGTDSLTGVETVVIGGTAYVLTDLTPQPPPDQPPVITSPATATAAENSAGTVYAATATDPENDTVTWSLAGGADKALFAVNAQTGAVSFVTAPDYEAPADSNGDNGYELVIEARDTANNVTDKAVTITVTNVNEAPTAVTLSNASVAENAAGAVIGTLAAIDPDVGDSHTFTVSDSRFEVVGDQLKLKDGLSLDYETEPSVALTVTATDAGGLSKAQAITLTVTNVNEAPTAVTLSNASVAENAAGAVIGTLAAIDPDVGDSHTFTVSDSRFEVVGDQLKLKDGLSLDYETEPSVALTVTATDAGGLSKAQAITLTVTNVNEAPTAVTLSNASVAENAAGAVIGTLAAIDPDVGDSHTFTVSDSRFEVVGDQLKLKDGLSLDYETEPSVALTVTATDAGGLSKAQAFTLTVTNVNEAPTAVTLSNASVAENAAGAVIGNLTAIDPDAGDSHTFTVSDPRFEVVDSQLKLKDGISLDYEAEPSVALTVTATDAGGLSKAQAITLTVKNVNDPPVITSKPTASVLETAAGPAYTATASDEDGDPLTWSIVGGTDAASFTINATTGALSFAKVPDYQVPTDTDHNNVYQVRLQASDGRGGTASEDVAITVTPDPNKPHILLLGAAGSELGYQSLSLGDVNGDGRLDIAVGGYNRSALFGFQNAAYVVTQGASGFSSPISVSASTALIVEGSRQWRSTYYGGYTSWGTAVTLGDLNHDGAADLLTGSATALRGTVYYGGTSGMDGTADAAMAMPADGPSSYYGDGLLNEAIGDFNGDGYADVIEGRHLGGPVSTAGATSVAVFAGSAQGISATPTMTVQGPWAWINGSQCNSDAAILGVGDINGDGRDDVLFGTQGCYTNSWEGDLLVGFGGTGSTMTTSRIDGFAQTGTNARMSLMAAIGDVNGDGIADVVWLDTSAGATLRVVYGRPGLSALGASMASGTIGASFTDSDFRGSVDQSAYGAFNGLQLGDVNGDGIADIVYEDAAGTGFRVVYGSRSFNGGFDLAAAGSAATTVYSYAGLGAVTPSSLAIGDITGDGLGDIVFGCATANNNAGAVYELNGTVSDAPRNLIGTVKADTLVGGAGADTLAGGAGNDTLIGGGGADTYSFGRGDGMDLVKNQGHGGDGDRVLFGANIGIDQLWFQQVGSDLRASVIGTSDAITIQGWYTDNSDHVSQFQTADGHTLADTQVQNLVAAMASLTPPPMGQTTLTAAQASVLEPVIGANWQAH